MRKLYFTIAVSILAFSRLCAAQSWQSDFPVHIEGRVGATLYSQANDGLWIQEGFGGNVKLAAPAIILGFTGNLYDAQRWGVAWHADYAWLGMARSDGMATANDADYNLSTKRQNGNLPLAHFVGSGHDYGFFATLEPYAKFGDWRLGVEFGPYLHNSQWSEDVTGLVWSAGQAPASAHVESHGGFHLSYVVGVTAHYKDIDASLMYFASGAKNGDPYPSIYTRAWVMTVGARF